MFLAFLYNKPSRFARGQELKELSSVYQEKIQDNKLTSSSNKNIYAVSGFLTYAIFWRDLNVILEDKQLISLSSTYIVPRCHTSCCRKEQAPKIGNSTNVFRKVPITIKLKMGKNLSDMRREVIP